MDENDKSKWVKLPLTITLVDGQNAQGVACDWDLTGAGEAWGSYTTDKYFVDISDDGRTIDIVDIKTGNIYETFYAELPE